MSYRILQQAAETRRSIYALNKQLPLSAAETAQIVEHAVKHTPSSFNSQSTRVVVLFGTEHEKLWQFAENALRAIVPANRFEPTAQKLAMFKAAAGTVLFFEDQNIIKGLQEQFPAYAENFPVWAEHADAMHQYAVWTTLFAAGIGANLQHYKTLPANGIFPTHGHYAHSWCSAVFKHRRLKKLTSRWRGGLKCSAANSIV